MGGRGSNWWPQHIAALLARYAGPVFVLVVSVLLTGYAMRRSLGWLDKPFPGFFLVSGGVVSTVAASDWPAGKAFRWPTGEANLFLSQVFAVDGSPIRTRREVYEYVAAHALDKTPVTYVFRRQGEELKQRIEPRNFTAGDYWQTCGLLFVFGCLSLAMAVVVGFMQPRTRQARVYLLSGFVAGMYPITGTLLYQPETSVFVTTTYLLCECMFPATMIHLALVFPVERRLPGAGRFWLAVPYAIGAALAAMALHGFYAQPPDLSVWPFTWAYTAFAFVFFYGAMALTYWENREPMARPRLKAMLVWLVVATVPPLVAFANNASPHRGLPLQYALVLGPIFFASVAYSIAKHDLFDTDRFLRQAFVYGLLSVVVIGAYALVLMIPERFAGDSPRLVGMAFVLALAFALDPLRRGVQHLVDRAYYREPWDYRKTISEQSQAMTSWVDLPAIVEHVTHLVTDQMHLESTALCLLDEGDNATVWVRDTDDRFTQSLVTADDARTLISEAGAGVILPLSFQGREIGTLKLGRKLSGRPFTHDDLDLLQTLANQAALAIQNARLHEAREDLRRKNEELGRAYTDLKHAQAQLVQSEKMASLGQWVAGAAHELNNPASFVHGSLANLAEYVQGFLDVIRAYEQLPLGETGEQRMVEEVRRRMKLDYLVQTTPRLLRACSEGSERIKKIVEDLLIFARADRGQRLSTDVAQTIESALRLLSRRITRDGVAIERDFQSIPPIEAHPAQLSQVWMNLLSNALDAVEGREHPEIRVAARLCSTRGTSDSNQSVEVEISDNGVGIAPDDRERMFEPFFTTKEIGRGTGLGLSIVYGTIKSHNGTITVDTEPGQGTTFRVRLPLQASAESSFAEINGPRPQ